MNRNSSTGSTIEVRGTKGIGCLERSNVLRTGRCCLVEVPDRSAETLVPIIRQWILPGTRILSDGWRAYANLGAIGNGIYAHDVIIHNKNFVHPDDPTIHTQRIEGLYVAPSKKEVEEAAWNVA